MPNWEEGVRALACCQKLFVLYKNQLTGILKTFPALFERVVEQEVAALFKGILLTFHEQV